MTYFLAVDRDIDARAAGAVGQWAYFGDDGAWRVAAEQGVLAGVPRVPTGELRERLAWELRTPFLDWIASLAPANDSLEWWSSELAAKNVYTMLYNRVCGLGAARRLIDGGLEPGTLLVCSTPAQRDAVGSLAAARGLTVEQLPLAARPGGRRAARLGRALAQHGVQAWPHIAPGAVLAVPTRASERARTVLEADGVYRRRTIERAGAADGGPVRGDDTVVLFTWVDRRSFGTDGGLRDPYFGRLSDMLEERGQSVAIVPDVLPSIPLDEAAARLLACGKRILFPELYLQGSDWREAELRAEGFRPSIPDDSLLDGLPVGMLAREHVEEYRRSHPRALRFALLVRRLAEAGVEPARIVYPCEGHGWEHALEWAVRRHLPATRLVAYENLNFSRLALSMYPGAGEAALAPRPDRIVTNGESFRDTLVAEGVPAETVVVGCALRHEYLWSGARAGRRPDPGQPIRVLAATSIHAGDAVELIERALLALGHSREFELVIKCHPVVEEHTVRASLGELGRDAVFTQQPIEELLPQSDVLLYTYTIVAYEALAHGVPPVYVKPDSLYPLDQLESTRDARWEARTCEELRDAVRGAARMDAAAFADWRERAGATVRRALGPVTSECVEAFLT